jgi:hypothetical protein
LVVDRQLQKTIYQFEHAHRVVQIAKLASREKRREGELLDAVKAQVYGLR